MTDRRAMTGALVPMVLLSVAAGGTRCSLSTDSGTGELRISGTVRFLETVGGCWRLDAGEGRHYELLPDQAPATLLQDGATATVTGQPAEDAETGCRVGLPLAVRRVLSLAPAPSPAR
jgi:hypothetical protein